VRFHKNNKKINSLPASFRRKWQKEVTLKLRCGGNEMCKWTWVAFRRMLLLLD
jgi:hypothetical protein